MMDRILSPGRRRLPDEWLKYVKNWEISESGRIELYLEKDRIKSWRRMGILDKTFYINALELNKIKEKDIDHTDSLLPQGSQGDIVSRGICGRISPEGHCGTYIVHHDTKVNVDQSVRYGDQAADWHFLYNSGQFQLKADGKLFAFDGDTVKLVDCDTHGDHIFTFLKWNASRNPMKTRARQLMLCGDADGDKERYLFWDMDQKKLVFKEKSNNEPCSQFNFYAYPKCTIKLF